LLTIYLDSSDYSTLADPPLVDADKSARVLEALRTYVAKKAIEVRYSVVHLSEMANLAPEHLGSAARRAKVLDDLSNGKCIRFPDSVFTDEIEICRDPRKGPWSKSIAYAEHNQWINSPVSKLTNIRKQLQSDIALELKARGYARKFRSKNIANKLGREFARSPEGSRKIDQAARDLYAEIPVKHSAELSDVLKRFALGDATDFEVKKIIAKSAMEPADLIEFLAPKLNATSRLSKIVRNVGADMAVTADQQFARVREFANLAEAVGRKEEAVQTLRKWISDMKFSFKVKLVRAHAVDVGGDIGRWTARLSDKEISKLTLPSADIAAVVLSRKMWAITANLLAHPSSPGWTPQDGVDFMHARFAPYVDIFRCDGGWQGPVAGAAKKFGTQVVGKIWDLCPAIEENLKTR